MAAETKKPAWPATVALLPALLAASCGSAGPPAGAGSLSAGVRTSPWSFAGIPGTQLDTRHYRIHTTSEDHDLLRALPGFLENAHRQYRLWTALPDPPPGAAPMVVYVLASRQQWAVMTRRVTGANSQTYLRIDSGGYCYRGVCVFWDLGHFATFSVAAHEGLHQFAHHRLADPIPAWAEEGLAVLAEGFNITATSVTFTPQRNALRQGDLRRAMVRGGGWPPLERLLSSDAADHAGESPDYYGYLWALMLFVRSEPRYRAGLERMIADAAAGRLRRALRVPEQMGTGRTYNRAVSVPMFRHYIDDDLGGFEARFRAFARKLAKLP